jgi:hypothetical protein
MWMQDDDGEGMVWEDALNYAESFSYANYDDWRLPNAKELQSILDYERAPSVTNSAAIDPLFSCSTIIDEGGEVNYPFYWTGTTHANWTENEGGAAAYVCFGEGLGWMESFPPGSGYTLMDVHGAGSQRSDPKTGDPANWPHGNGPQGDVIRIFNFVRLVRDVDSTTGFGEMNFDDSKSIKVFPSPATDYITVATSDNFLGVSTIQIFDLTGGLAYSNTKELSQNTDINISDFKPGFYFLKLQNEGEVFSKKFVKK